MENTIPAPKLTVADHHARWSKRRDAIRDAFCYDPRQRRFESIFTDAEPANDAFVVADTENLDDARVEVYLSMSPELIAPHQRVRALEFACIMVEVAKAATPVAPLEHAERYQVVSDTRRRDDFEKFNITHSHGKIICTYAPDPNSETCVNIICEGDRFPHIAPLVSYFFNTCTTY